MIKSLINRADDRKRGVVGIERARCDLPAPFTRQDPAKLLFRLSFISPSPTLTAIAFTTKWAREISRAFAQ
jgi:hypothetical protein